MKRLVKILFFALFVRPIVLILLGLNVRNKTRVPGEGPAILVANHNSHLDTLVLMSLFTLGEVLDVRPAAAEDYFFKTPLMRWFSTYCLDCVPVARVRDANRTVSPLAEVHKAIENKQIIIFFPEGSRGAPEQMIKFKAGIGLLSEKFPEVPVVPVFLHGLGKALPKGEALLVPFFLDIFVGESLCWNGSNGEFVRELEARVKTLGDEANLQEWV